MKPIRVPGPGRPHEFWPDPLSPAVMSEVRMAETAQEALRQPLFPQGGYEGQLLTPDEFAAGCCLSDMTPGSINVDVDARARVVACIGS